MRWDLKHKRIALPYGPRRHGRACMPGHPAIRGSLRSRGRLAPVQPLPPEWRNAYIARFLLEPGLHRKVPGLFVFLRPADGIGIRACLRNMIFRVRIPGGVPDFDGSEALPYRSGIATGRKRIVLLQLGMWQYRAGIAQWKSATLPASRREFDSRCPPQRVPVV